MSGYPTMGGAGDSAGVSLGESVNAFTSKYIGGYYNVVFLVLVVILIVWFYRTMWKAAESFMPTATLRAQSQQQAAVDSPAKDATARAIMQMYGRSEGMEPGEQGRAVGPASATPVVSAATDPSSPLFPGSPSWQVLNSPAFNCGGRDLEASANAWGWMNQVAHEKFGGSRPTSDEDFSRIAAGL